MSGITAASQITVASPARRRLSRPEASRAVLTWLATVRRDGLVGAMTLPSPLLLGGVACLAPLLVLGVYATGVDVDSRALLSRLLLAYAVFVVSFLGALWALLIDGPQAEGEALLSPERMAQAERGRLLIGIVPAVVGGVALLSSFSVGLMLLVLDLAGCVAFEAWSGRGRLKPARHLRLRWSVAFVAIAILLDVMIYRMYGTRIVF